MRARLHQVLHLVRDGGEGRVIQLRHLYNKHRHHDKRDKRVKTHVYNVSPGTGMRPLPAGLLVPGRGARGGGPGGT